MKRSQRKRNATKRKKSNANIVRPEGVFWSKMRTTRREFFRHTTIGAAVSAATLRLNELSAGARDRSNAAPQGEAIRLDVNINPYGPSPRVVEMIRTKLEEVNRYPDTAYRHLSERIADFHRVKPNQITLGAGSREVLRMAVAAFLPAGKRLVLASPTFEPIASLAKQAGAELTAVPINKYYAHDLDAMLHRTNAATGLVYICNPNNPTGSLTPRKDLETFLQKLPPRVVVVIDEAYHEYVGSHSDYASFVDRPIDDKRVLVTRTFSKIHGLAGLRLGYGVSSEDMARQLSPLRLENGVNIVAAHAAVAALDDSEYVALSSSRNADERQEFYNQTNARMLRQIDSHTNFVFLRFGLSSSQVFQHYEQNNIILGPVVPQWEKHIRVAIGTQTDMREFWRVWDLMPASPHQMASTLIG